MQISERQVDGVTVLDLSGKITIGVGDMALREAVRRTHERGGRKVLLNLKDVSQIDSSGIGELVSSYTMTTNRGGKLKLENLPPKVRDILHITQLITVFEVYEDEKEAVASYQ